MAKKFRSIPRNAITDLSCAFGLRPKAFVVDGTGLMKRRVGRPEKNKHVFRVVDGMFSNQCVVVPIPGEYESKPKNYTISMRNGANGFCKPRDGRRISAWRTVHGGVPVLVIQWVRVAPPPPSPSPVTE